MSRYAMVGPRSGELLSFQRKVIVHHDRAEMEFLFPNARVVPVTRGDLGQPTMRLRDHPEIIDGSRRRRISKGSGRTPQEVNQLLKEFEQMRLMMTQMMKMGKMLPTLPKPSATAGGGQQGPSHAQMSKSVRQAQQALKVKPKHRRHRKTKKKRR